MIIVILFIFSSKIKTLKDKIEKIKDAQNKFSQQGNEHLKVLRDFAHEAGFCIQEKTTILNESDVINFGAKPRIGKLLRLVESPEAKENREDREEFEKKISPSIDKIIEGIESGKIKPMTIGVDIKKKKV